MDIKRIIECFDAVDKRDRDFCLDLIKANGLSGKILNELYDYYFKINKKWLYRDNWEGIRSYLKDWKKKQKN